MKQELQQCKRGSKTSPAQNAIKLGARSVKSVKQSLRGGS